MSKSLRRELSRTLDEIRDAGLYKEPRPISSPQSARITVSDRSVLNFCSNNYLGLADHPDVIKAAKESLDQWGFGTASGRFICGTQEPHVLLERRLSDFLGTEETILYGSCFDANGGIFETLLGEGDAVISDELNHASIIDGIRLSKAARYRYKSRDMAGLENQLRAAQGVRHRLIVTDGVFSMDGYIAPLREICDLADQYDALVMVDDSHAVGSVGEAGRETPELCGVDGRIDLLTGTLGKTLGGASGGYASGHAEIIDMLRQRSRPYLFSNSVAPPIVGASLRILDLLAKTGELRSRLRHNAALFRESIVAAGFDVLDGEHPIIPVMIGDAAEATAMATALLERGVYVTAFSYPVVPMGTPASVSSCRPRTTMTTSRVPSRPSRRPARRSQAEHPSGDRGLTVRRAGVVRHDRARVITHCGTPPGGHPPTKHRTRSSPPATRSRGRACSRSRTSTTRRCPSPSARSRTWTPPHGWSDSATRSLRAALFDASIGSTTPQTGDRPSESPRSAASPAERRMRDNRLLDEAWMELRRLELDVLGRWTLHPLEITTARQRVTEP